MPKYRVTFIVDVELEAQSQLDSLLYYMKNEVYRYPNEIIEEGFKKLEELKEEKI